MPDIIGTLVVSHSMQETHNVGADIEGPMVDIAGSILMDKVETPIIHEAVDEDELEGEDEDDDPVTEGFDEDFEIMSTRPPYYPR